MERAVNLFHIAHIASGTKDKELFRRMDELKEEMDAVEKQFNLAEDSSLIEACCYQMKALSVKYRSLLREAKRQGVRREPFAE